LPSASADGLKGLEAKPPPLWVLTPFNAIYERGLKPTEEPAKLEQSSIHLLKQTAKEKLRHKKQTAKERLRHKKQTAKERLRHKKQPRLSAH